MAFLKDSISWSLQIKYCSFSVALQGSIKKKDTKSSFSFSSLASGIPDKITKLNSTYMF